MENKNAGTIADAALAGATVPQTGEGVAPAPKAATETSKYKPGLYRSEKFMRIIKELTAQHQVGDDGKIKKTYGTWVKEDNMIIFQKGVERRLTAEDLKLTAVQRLIDSKTIFKVGD